MAQKILIVENDEDARTGIAAFFEAYGFEVRSTSRADEAINLGRDFVADILIADWMLEGDGDGVEVARTLYTSCPWLAIVLMSGRSMERLRFQAHGLPVQSFMPKPVSLFDLRSVIDLILERGLR